MPVRLISSNQYCMIWRRLRSISGFTKLLSLVSTLITCISLLMILNVCTRNYVWMRFRVFTELRKALCHICLDWLHTSTIRAASITDYHRLSGPSTPLQILLHPDPLQSLFIEHNQTLLEDFFFLYLFRYLNWNSLFPNVRCIENVLFAVTVIKCDQFCDRSITLNDVVLSIKRTYHLYSLIIDTHMHPLSH